MAPSVVFGRSQSGVLFRRSRAKTEVSSGPSVSDILSTIRSLSAGDRLRVVACLPAYFTLSRYSSPYETRRAGVVVGPPVPRRSFSVHVSGAEMLR